MSFKSEVQTDSTGKWYGNALRFETKDEAEAQVRDLSMRWTSVLATRVVESEDEVTHSWYPKDGLIRHVQVVYKAQPKNNITLDDFE